MATFKDYARYYNLLYRDKDYAGESSFILSILGQTGSLPQTILDLGCGTGRHAMEMTKKGIAVTGVDLSPTMLEMGKAAQTPGLSSPGLLEGDVRTARLGRTYDAVTSLFHVMSYQTTHEDALALFHTARAHLALGGLFLFDFWFGPGVLHQGPEHRIKHLEDHACTLRREATPTLFADTHVINVHYDMELTDKHTGTLCRFSEDHPMRYWFLPELREMANAAQFTVLQEGGWLNTLPPSKEHWSAWMLVQAKEQARHV